MSQEKQRESSISFTKSDQGPILTVVIPLDGVDAQVYAYGVLAMAKEQVQHFYTRRAFQEAQKKANAGIIKP